MEIIYGILIVMLIVLVIMILSSCLTLFTEGNQRDFARVYKDLPNRKFYLNFTQVYSHNCNEKDDEFVWFIETGSFKISERNCLHNMSVTYFSPFHLYWLIKYNRWFKKYVDIKTIEKFCHEH